MLKKYLKFFLVLLLWELPLMAQVLERDSLALVAFYDDTFGSSWINNEGWLESPVGQWYGVGLDPGGQVITLKLPDNGLQGSISNSIVDLVSLHVLDVSGNRIEALPEIFNEMEVSVVDAGHNDLSSLPDYSAITRTFTLYVNDNLLDFSDLEINAQLPGLFYHPQKNSNQEERREVELGDSQQLIAQVPGTFNSYQWFLNQQLLEGATSPTLNLPAISFEDLGDYHCVVQNQLLPALAIQTTSINLQSITNIQGELTDQNGDPLEADLRVYLRKGLELSPGQAPELLSGKWSDHPIAMGYYLVKAIPHDPTYPPVYLGTPSHLWEQAEEFRFDGNQQTLEFQLQTLPALNGNHTLNGSLILQQTDPSELDVYLYQKQAQQETLVAHTKVDADLLFEFDAVAPGTYKVYVDLPGLSTASSNDLEVPGNTGNIQIDLNENTLLPPQSIARQWNELLLEAIRNDYARPTVHARNLFHLSAAMYDTWSVFQSGAVPYLLGNTLNEFRSFFQEFNPNENLSTALEKAISYCAFRMLTHRFRNSPNAAFSLQTFHQQMTNLGFDPEFASTDYTLGDAAALGNHVAETYIRYGLQDGSNEQQEYANRHYQPLNQPLVPAFPGNPHISDYNHWQPLSLEVFIDQAGNVIPRNTPDFLSPEWGLVAPFALTDEDAVTYHRDDYPYQVYFDPGPPPLLDLNGDGTTEEAYKWGFNLVSIWSAQMDPSDGVIWDISPASLGNNPWLPHEYEQYEDFYLLEGGDVGSGRPINPITGAPYVPQRVPRGDYVRVVAEFWADGPDSETPPGHWFTLLNYVSDHPLFEKRFQGTGAPLDPLEWDIKAYFTLGGAMHDAAISAWGIKGWYDYLRPISAIRALADLGQSSDPAEMSYHPDGIPLVEHYIELVSPNDPLAGPGGENVGKIKLYAWRGPDYIINPENFSAGVGWILAENWWPYQRPSFVTPPFAGYVSGHSTYSRAAAEVLTLLTGDEYFPGGLGEFLAKKDEFLVFEEGPSVDVTLQWATYRDASDETSLSRIWGGIHPPADDIPGRIIGEQIGIQAFDHALSYFQGNADITRTRNIDQSLAVYPIPADGFLTLQFQNPGEQVQVSMYNQLGRHVLDLQANLPASEHFLDINIHQIPPGFYLLKVVGQNWDRTQKLLIR